MNAIERLQTRHRVWVQHNFPNQQPHDALLGIAEEVGELCHAHLKRDQGIRAMTDEAYVEQASDALGDIFIYMMSYANTNGFNLSQCIFNAWNQVEQRDWQAEPDTAWVMPSSGEQL